MLSLPLAEHAVAYEEGDLFGVQFVVCHVPQQYEMTVKQVMTPVQAVQNTQV